MPNDAKLGLVIGVGLVLLIAVVFFGRERAVAGSRPPSPAAQLRPPIPPPAAETALLTRP